MDCIPQVVESLVLFALPLQNFTFENLFRHFENTIHGQEELRSGGASVLACDELDLFIASQVGSVG